MCCLRTKFLLAPLTEKVSNLEAELSSLTGRITEKQEELNTLKMKIVESGGVRWEDRVEWSATKENDYFSVRLVFDSK